MKEIIQDFLLYSVRIWIPKNSWIFQSLLLESIKLSSFIFWDFWLLQPAEISILNLIGSLLLFTLCLDTRRNSSYLRHSSPGKHPVKQYADVWAFSRLQPTILRKDQFKLIFNEILSNANRFNSFMTKSLRNGFSRQNLYFCERNFLWPLWNWRVTLQ